MTAVEMFGIITPIVVAIMVGWGAVLLKISNLERKIDKYNGLAEKIERANEDIEHIRNVCPLCPKTEGT